MPSRDERSALLHTFDHAAADLTDDRARRLEAGRTVARDEIDSLTALAGVIRRTVGEWDAGLTPLDLERPFDAHRAEALILESVFDELLAPDSLRVLSAAIAMAPDRA